MAYNVIKPVKIVSAGDMSANITSSVVEVIYQDNISVQLVWTGTPTGDFEFQVSNTYRLNVVTNTVEDPGVWTTLPVTPAIVAAGSADNAFVDLNQTGAAFMRVVYTRTSGSGQLDIFVAAKGI